MNASMGSIRHWVRSAKPLPDHLGYDPWKDMVLSWSDINLFVDLCIDQEGPENVGNISQTAVADGTEMPSPDHEDDAAKEPPGTTQELHSLQHDTEPIRDLLVNHQIYEKDCNHDVLKSQKNKDRHSDNEPSSDAGSEAEAAAAPDRNCPQCAWPDWGEPLPPEDADDDINVDDAAGQKSPTLKKVVTFSDVVMVVEPSSLQEERETDSFSYAGSSDEELEHAADQVTISSSGNSDKESLNSADVSAACHLLELGNELNHGDSQPIEVESLVGVCGKRKCCDYDSAADLERLSELIEKIYAAAPELSIVNSSQGSVSSREVGSWTIKVSKDSLKIALKKIPRQEAEFEGLGCAGLEDASEVLERPPSKRLYKRLNGLL